MKNSKSNHVRILYEICEEEKIVLHSYSADWAFQCEKDGRKSLILGYQFGLNSDSARAVSTDKAVASELLIKEGVPCVPHFCYMAPHMFKYTGGAGNWQVLLNYLAKQKEIVCKDNQGTGGNLVFHVKNTRQLEEAAAAIFARADAMAVCPYEAIAEEYRVILLDQQRQLVFAKKRPHLTGDGEHTLAELWGQAISQGGISGEVPSRQESKRILAKGEIYPLNWKHNLGQGADAVLVTDERLLHELEELAVCAVRALNLRFASVDIIKTAAGLNVLEVNSGVMMENFAGMSEENYQIAKDIYRRAVLETLK